MKNRSLFPVGVPLKSNSIFIKEKKDGLIYV